MITESIKEEEEVVISWLKSHGYYKVVRRQSEHYIEADGKIRRMIVAVRTSTMTNIQIEPIKELAGYKNREAWVADVNPEDNDITWTVLK